MKVISIFKKEPYSYQASNFIKTLRKQYDNETMEKVLKAFTSKKLVKLTGHEIVLFNKLVNINKLLTRDTTNDMFFKRFIKAFIIAKQTKPKEIS